MSADAAQRHREALFFRRQRPLGRLRLREGGERFAVQRQRLLRVPAGVLDATQEHTIGEVGEVDRRRREQYEPVIAA
jgi:hypothetical protein